MFGMMVITNAGAALVRQAASAEKKIVFTRSCYGSSWDDSRADLANKPIDWYDVGVGTILGVNAGSGGLKVVAQHAVQLIPVEANPNPKDPSPVISEAPAELIEAPKPVKAVCICAQLAKDGVNPEYDPQDDVIFAATCNDNSCFTWADSFTVDFDLPIPMSAVVDDTGSTSGDCVTLDTEQTITGAKTFTNKIVCLAGEDSIEIEEGLKVYNSADESNGNPYIIFAASGGSVVDSNGNEVGFEYAAMPLEVAYSTANKTIDLTIGDGTVVRLTCTNVEENPE